MSHSEDCCWLLQSVVFITLCVTGCCWVLCALQGGAPPEPLAQCLREPDVAVGVMEVQQLGLVGLLMQQHGVGGLPGR